jgi:hypothetical protein
MGVRFICELILEIVIMNLRFVGLFLMSFGVIRFIALITKVMGDVDWSVGLYLEGGSSTWWVVEQ